MGTLSLLLLTLVSLPFSQGMNLREPCGCGGDNPCHVDYNLVCGRKDETKPCTCVCPTIYVEYPPKNPIACVTRAQATGSKKVGESCDTEGCADPLLCDLDSTPRVCRCPLTSTLKDQCKGKGPGSTCNPAASDCAATLECTSEGTCECPKDRQWDGDEKCLVKVDRDCTEGGDRCLPNAECLEGKCKCVAYYALNDVDKTCATNIVPIGGTCRENADCLPKLGLECNSGKCACSAKFEWIEGICKDKSDLHACDPEAEVDTCAENEVKNLVCDKDKRICTCPINSAYSDTAKACKLNGGEECTVKGTAEHGLCYSQFCVDAQHKSTYGKCDCRDGNNGQRRIWMSSPPGCVDDKSGFPCEKDKDCQFPNLKHGRQGMICKDNRCVCDTGYSYQYGYCFKDEDIKGHDSPCDRKGTFAVCNVTGTGLACRSPLEGTAHKCLCLSKDVKRGAEPTKYVKLEWDAAQGKCAFKAEGMTCDDKEECRGKVCADGKCMGDEKSKKRGGATTVASGYAEVMLLLTFPLVMRHI